MTVARGSASITRSMSKASRKISREPASKVTLQATNRPWVWKIGSACRRTSSGANPQASCSVRAFESRLSWVSIAPFERPVVPEV